MTRNAPYGSRLHKIYEERDVEEAEFVLYDLESVKLILESLYGSGAAYVSLYTIKNDLEELQRIVKK